MLNMSVEEYLAIIIGIVFVAWVVDNMFGGGGTAAGNNA